MKHTALSLSLNSTTLICCGFVVQQSDKLKVVQQVVQQIESCTTNPQYVDTHLFTTCHL